MGLSLSEDHAPVVLRAIKAAAANILRNPARFTIRKSAVRLDKGTLTRFGRFRVPAMLWDTFSRYACWVEPAIENEWTNLMGSWDLRYAMDVYHKALQWAEWLG